MRSDHRRKTFAPNVLQEKNIVIVHDKLHLFWKTGQITKRFAGKDGYIRSCRVRLTNGTEIVQSLCFRNSHLASRREEDVADCNLLKEDRGEDLRFHTMSFVHFVH